MKRLLAAGADVNGHTPWACWFTPPMHCLRYPEARRELAQLLLDRGADVNRADGELCSTPPGWAARCGRVDMAALLLERGADPWLPREHPWARPRRWAEKKGHSAVLAMLPE